MATVISQIVAVSISSTILWAIFMIFAEGLISIFINDRDASNL